MKISFRDRRLAAGLTQKEAAAAIGVDQSAVAQWDSGKTSPTAAKLPKIAQVYGCTVDELLSDKAQGRDSA